MIETHHFVASHTPGIKPATQIDAHDWESNPKPFSAQANALTTEQYQPGPKQFINYKGDVNFSVEESSRPQPSE